MKTRPDAAWPFPTKSATKAAIPPLTKIENGKKTVIFMEPPAPVVVEKTTNLTVQECNDYVKSHGTLLPNGQVFLTKPLKVFKKIKSTTGLAIANLIIPKGALVNLAKSSEKKMRASMAVCHSIYGWKSYNRLNEGFSGYNSETKYSPILGAPGERFLEQALKEYYTTTTYSYWNRISERYIVHPDKPFATGSNDCDSGIHFFVEKDVALNYSL